MIDTQTIKSKLKELNQSIETLICSFLNDIKEQIEQIENPDKIKRVNKGDKYYLINDDGKDKNIFTVAFNTEDYDNIDNKLFNGNNYFLTQERAQEVADKINFILRLERLHDELCSNYTPDWTNENTEKYSIYYNNETNSCDYNCSKFWEPFGTVYFPTRDIVLKACDILDKELENNK